MGETTPEGGASKLQVTIEGPAGSTYEGGTFTLEVQLTLPEHTTRKHYPFAPPRVHFVTKIYHCNVRENGKFKLDHNYDLLDDAWSPAQTLQAVFERVSDLLANPDPSEQLPELESLWQLYMSDRSTYDDNARRHTTLHA